MSSKSKKELLEYIEQLEDLVYLNSEEQVFSTYAIVPSLLKNSRSVKFKTRVIIDFKNALENSKHSELIKELKKFKDSVNQANHAQ